MKIAIDSSRSEVEHPTGVSLYSAEVVSRVEKILLDAGQQLSCYSREAFRQKHDKRATLRVIRPKYFWTLVGLSIEQLRRSQDLLFVPVHVLPLITPKRTVVTVHDVAYMHFPSAYSWRSNLYLRWSIKRIVKRATRIICISEATRQDLIEKCHADPAKLRVVYNGFKAPAEAKPDAALQQSLLHKLRLTKGEYLISVGRIEEKKNLVRLITAFNAVVKTHQFPHKLLLVGSDGVGSEQIKKHIRTLGIEGSVVLAGYLDEAAKWQLLRGATALCFPSLYEGFGYPILEAYAAATPVLTSKASSMPELAGPHGAAYVDPLDPESISKGILTLLTNVDLRNSLIRSGRERLAHFTWDVAAQETAAIIIELTDAA